MGKHKVISVFTALFALALIFGIYGFQAPAVAAATPNVHVAEAVGGGWNNMWWSAVSSCSPVAYGNRLVLPCREQNVNREDTVSFPNNSLNVQVSDDRGTTWTEAVNVGGDLTAPPTATTCPAGVCIFARGSDNALYGTVSSDGYHFGSWSRIGGYLLYGPAAAELNGRVYVFAVGTGNQVYVVSSGDGLHYGGWTDLGGIASSAPAATQAGANSLYVAVRGQDGQLYLMVLSADLSSGGWNRQLAGQTVGDPAIGNVGGMATMYVVAPNGNLLAGTPMDGWTNLGGVLTGRPGVAVLNGRTYIFARGSDGSLYEMVR